MLLSAVSVLVVAQLSSEFLEGLMNYPVQVSEVPSISEYVPVNSYMFQRDGSVLQF
jgi:hypothetical protein